MLLDMYISNIILYFIIIYLKDFQNVTKCSSITGTKERLKIRFGLLHRLCHTPNGLIL